MRVLAISKGASRYVRPAPCSGRGERAGLATVYGPALTGWTEALRHPPTLAGVTGASSQAPATKVVANVSLTSPVSSRRGNALGYALCCGRHDRTMSRLGGVWSKAESSNRANSNSNQNFSHGGLLPNDDALWKVIAWIRSINPTQVQ